MTPWSHKYSMECALRSYIFRNITGKEKRLVVFPRVGGLHQHSVNGRGE